MVLVVVLVSVVGDDEYGSRRDYGDGVVMIIIRVLVLVLGVMTVTAPLLLQLYSVHDLVWCW